MLKNVAIPVHTDTAFPFGASAVTEVTPIFSFDKGKRGEQQVDEATGLPVYEVTVLDNDPELKGPAKAVKVKIFSATQPVPPAPIPGLPAGMYVAPVEFDGLTAKPYCQEFMEGRYRVAWSLTARGLRSPGAPEVARSNGSPRVKETASTAS